MSLKEFITTSYSKEIYLDKRSTAWKDPKCKTAISVITSKSNSISVPKNKFSLKLKDTYHQFMIKCIL